MKEKLYRTFIALESNKELKALMETLIEKLKKIGFKSNWTKNENVHLTMIFLGNISMQQIAKISYKAGERIFGFPTFTFKVDKLGYFTDNGIPKVLWLNVSGGETLNGLYSEFKKSVIQSDIEISSEAFVPHITVGRVKKHPDYWDHLIKEITFEPIDVPVNSVGLYSSQLKKTGPVYTKLYTIDFEGGVIING